MKVVRKIAKFFPSVVGRVLALSYLVMFIISLIYIMKIDACANNFAMPCSLFDVILLPVLLLMWLLWIVFDPLFDLLTIKIVGLQAQIPWFLALLLWMVMLYYLGVVIEKMRKHKPNTNKITTKSTH